jgi:hypothetical protein
MLLEIGSAAAILRASAFSGCGAAAPDAHERDAQDHRDDAGSPERLSCANIHAADVVFRPGLTRNVISAEAVLRRSEGRLVNGVTEGFRSAP